MTCVRASGDIRAGPVALCDLNDLIAVAISFLVGSSECYVTVTSGW